MKKLILRMLKDLILKLLLEYASKKSNNHDEKKSVAFAKDFIDNL